MSKPRTIIETSDDVAHKLHLILPFATISPVVHFDRNYAYPTENWVRRGLLPGCRHWVVKDLGLEQWLKHHDCNKKAELLQTYSMACLAQLGTSKYESFTVFRVAYNKGGIKGLGHAINLILLKDKEGKDKHMFVEPQVFRSVHLTKKERESSWYVY